MAERANQTVAPIYPVAGKQLPFSAPERFCLERDMTNRLVGRLVDEIGEQRIRIEIRPWARNVLGALRRGGWHPPVVTIDGRLFSQGVIPDEAAPRDALLAAVNHAARASGPVGDSGRP